jgi:hypothetical protein
LRINLKGDQFADKIQAVAKDELGSIQGSVQVADHAEVGALNISEPDGRPAGGVNASANGSGLKVRVDRFVDGDEASMFLKVDQTIA